VIEMRFDQPRQLARGVSANAVVLDEYALDNFSG